MGYQTYLYSLGMGIVMGIIFAVLLFAFQQLRRKIPPKKGHEFPQVETMRMLSADRNIIDNPHTDHAVEDD